MKTRFLRGATAENNGLTLPAGELSIDTERRAVRLHDGSTLGGFEMVGTQAFTPINGPGPNYLVAGDDMAGFYGEVPTSDLFSGDELASAIGLSSGVSMFNTEPWLKFSYQGKTLFVAKKGYRYGLSWDDLNALGLVYGNSGDPTVTLGDDTFKVRLINISTSLTIPENSGYQYDPSYMDGSEWSTLMYRVHDGNHTNINNNTPAGSWASYSDAGLNVHADYNANGVQSWTQQAWETDATMIAVAGYKGISAHVASGAKFSYDGRGWRPVLELVV